MDHNELINRRKERMQNSFQRGLMLQPKRWMSFREQVILSDAEKPNNILEIGKGNGLYLAMMSAFEYEIDTLDINEYYQPTYVGNICDVDLDKTYDLVVGFQMLQHIQLSELNSAIRNMCSIANKCIIVSIPHFSPQYFSFRLILPDFFKKIGLPINYDFFTRLKFKRYKDREYSNKEESYHAHYWELGRGNMTEQKFCSYFEKFDFKKTKSFSPSDFPYHNFFVFHKK